MTITPEKIAEVLKKGTGVEAEARECPNCYWYEPDGGLSGEIFCINLGRDNWNPIEEKNTCNDFVLPCDFKPDHLWGMLVEAVDQEIKKR